MRRVLAALIVFTVLGGGLSAQPSAVGRRPSSEGLQVFLITIGQGGLYWEKYGHNMLWFYDPGSGVDVAYSWGGFDFAQPGFFRRQIIGDPIYRLEAYPGQLILDNYRLHDRGIVIQRLNLAPDQKRKALDYSMWNAREENKNYRYDYYRDNCSTRVRDVIDLALGGRLKAMTSATATALTYKSETTRLLDDMNVIQFGVNVALGRPADRPLSTWETMFIPMRMRDALGDVRVTDSTGASVPLVAEERVVYQSTQYDERDDAPALWFPYLIIGLLIGSELLAASFVGRKSGALEKVFRFEVAAWSLITGLFGAILLVAWLITEHVFWYHNENLLIFNPLSLFLVALAPLSLWRQRWLRPAAICAVMVALLGALAVVLKGLPNAQHNVPLVLLVVPTHFAIAYGLWRRSAGRAGASAENASL